MQHRSIAASPLVVLLLSVLTACTGAQAYISVSAPDADEPDHPVIVVSIDGLRPDAIERYPARTLQRLLREGAYSLEAQTIVPSRTLPSHTSMLTGVGPEVHGITWNEQRFDEHGIVAVPTMFDLASAEGLRTAAFVGKAKLNHLLRPQSLDHHQSPRSNRDYWLATRTIPDAIAYMEARRPDLLFVHISEPDLAGHATGWMSFAYGWAVRRADGAVATLLEAADRIYGKGAYTLILTSDHGGHGRDHGTEDARDMTIPWIVWGRGVEVLGPIDEPIRTMDTAATALWLLGVRIPEDWQGRPIKAPFGVRAPVVEVPASGSSLR